ncbi:MAG TPA: hypothetical protein VET45_02870 [Candidatus Binatia bacterium]|nr:hypothetical protein [Candidatus Binatia bacterium]
MVGAVVVVAVAGGAATGEAFVHVMALSTPSRPGWRWRIVNYAGELVEESRDAFRTIALAVAEGTRRLKQMDTVDRSEPPRPYRSTSHLRGRWRV